MIKYGELSTKKENINFFIKCLKNNIEFVLDGLDCKIEYDKGRMFILPNENIDDIIDKLKMVFGIHKIVVAYRLKNNNIEEIEKLSVEILNHSSFKTFKVESRRSDKLYPLKSPEISKNIGAYILKNMSNIKVNVKNPDIVLNIEIRKNEALIYYEEIKGLGGYPVSSLGKGLLMLSGGIDSPVAGFLSSKRGVKLEALYFESPPHTSIEARNKVINLAKKLATYNIELKLHIVNITDLQEAILKNIPHDYLITILRRMMYRIATRIAKRNKCHILINGESIGQVASQTLTSMKVINEVTDLPVIRPVACFDKSEIITIAQNIDTFTTSILPYEDCCTIFVPKHPVINPIKEKCEEYEQLIDFENFIKAAVKNETVIKIRLKEEKKYQDIL